MADNITIIRLEVTGTVGKEQSSGNSANISPGTLVATAGIKGSLFDKTGNINKKLDDLYGPGIMTFSDINAEINSGFIGGLKGYRSNSIESKIYLGKAKLLKQQGINDILTNSEYDYYNKMSDAYSEAARINLNEAKTAAARNTKKYGPKMATTALAAYSIYSQYQSVGYNLSGASHAAQVQQRTTQSATFAAGLGLSIATGQYWATGMMLAGRAWQLAQQNRQELYQIRSSQIISQVMQERLVKDTIQRRF